MKHIDFEVPDWGEFASPPSEIRGYQAEILADNPVAYWRLNDSVGATTVADQINGNDLDVDSQVSLGQPGLTADGSTTCAELADSASGRLFLSSPPAVFTPQLDQTIEVWAHAKNLSAAHGIISYAPDGDSQYAIRFHPNQTVQTVWKVGGTFYKARSQSDAVPPGVTYHIAVTIDASGVLDIYINGVHDVASSSLGDLTGATELQIGQVGNARFDGFLDEVAVYSAALSANRIRDHYQAGTWHLAAL